MDGIIKVLIVDDEEMIRRILCDFLEDDGFQVDSASTGEEAVGKIASGDFHAAIVDMRLPDMDGNACILTCLKDHPHMVFFVHTGSHDYVVNETMQQAGMDPANVFYKPISDMTEVGARIKEALAKKQSS